MEVTIDYASPFIFAAIVSAFLAFFVIFRNFRLHLNALFTVLSVFSSIWFFLFFVPDDRGDSTKTLYVIALSAIVSYFLLLTLHRQESLKTKAGRFLPESYLFSPSWMGTIMAIEVFLISLSLLVFVIPSIGIFILSAETSLVAEQSVFVFSFLFLVESAVLSVISVNRLIGGLKKLIVAKPLVKFLTWFFALSWLGFSLGSLIVLTGNSVVESFVTISLLSFVIIQALLITHRYFLSYKVLLTQFIAALIVIFNITSILNSGSVEEIVLRTILIVVLSFLSHLLVKSVVSEIRKRKQIQNTAQKIYEANKTLHKLDRAKSDFINAASHQLRSPLSVIKGISSMLLDGSYGKLTDSIKDALEKVFISNERLIGLIESLLNISHLEEGKVDFNFAKINLNDIAQKAVDGLALQARNKKLYVKFSPWKKSKLLPWVDEQKVTEAISNLIDNAVKYTRKGGVTVQVQKIGENARISVSDTGIGLKKDEIKNLFQKFVRTGRGNKLSTVGTGLGLYVVRKMIEAHRGKIWAESAGEGRGSSFIIELPLNQKTPPDEKFVKKVVMEKQPA